MASSNSSRQITLKSEENGSDIHASNQCLPIPVREDNADKEIFKYKSCKIVDSSVNNVNKEINFKIVKRPFPESETVKFTASFESSFCPLTGISLITPTKAYVYNNKMAKVIDIVKAKVIMEYKAYEETYSSLKAIGENHFYFLDTVVNKMFCTGLKNPIYTILDFNAGSTHTQSIKAIVFTIMKTGEILIVLSKLEGCVCCRKYVPYIQKYGGQSNQILQKEAKLQSNGRNLIQDAYDIVENNNGSICITAEKCSNSFLECIVFLDSNFNLRFTYEGEMGCTFSPSYIAVDSINNILVINNLESIDIITDSGKYVRSLPLERFKQEGAPRRIAVDSDDKVWIITNLHKIVGLQLENPKMF